MKSTTKYITGTQIPEKEILRRFRDEDGEIFLEVRGNEDVLYRVTDGDTVYYKIEKSKMKGEDLTLVVDYTIVRPKTFSFSSTPKPKKKEIKEDDGTETDSVWGPVVDMKKEKRPKNKNTF